MDVVPCVYDGSIRCIYGMASSAGQEQRAASREYPVPVVEESVVVALPQQDVFDFLAKFENLSAYDAFVTASGQVGDGPPGLGT